MNKTLEITGMSCEHCASHVKAALEGVDGVTHAEVSLPENQADVTLSSEVTDDELIAAVEASGYHADI